MDKEGFQISEQEIEAIDRLRPIWFETVAGLGGNIENAEVEFKNIVKMYRQGDARAYHNILHVDRIVSLIRKISHLARRPHALTAAAIGHDIDYIAGSPTNEFDSGETSGAILERLGVGAEPILEIKRLIMITKDHTPGEDDVDGKILTDGDFEILGSPPPIYRWYSTGIYAENVGSGKVSVADYKTGRGRYLSSWLKQIEESSLFFTPEIRDALQPQALENITEEMEFIATL